MIGFVEKEMRFFEDINKNQNKALGFRISKLGFRVWKFEIRVQGLGFRVFGSGLRVQNNGLRGLGFDFLTIYDQFCGFVFLK